jgi:hypothetical protein
MSTPKLLTAAMLGSLCLLAALPHARAAGGDDDQPGQQGQQGMVVTRDPVTNKLRAPTPEEMQALRAKTSPRAGLQAARPSEHTMLAARPGGARGVRLGEKTLVYEVVTRGADGKLSSECVHGDAAAAAAVAPVAGPNAATRPAHADHEEQRHETR